jgi:hypothetical protein|uniref:Uncharacterized protein n=1 Tax=uncultured marine crenarchaeote HF4000_ANIW133C7 TaxID=455570 RepID=B3T3T6_9ARCH|nr:hypothetical protein ALOHA_HF4000ANIW133C7ctg1g52 [uncultured marine crenarchaeote HF4000_ANIW133C7]
MLLAKIKLRIGDNEIEIDSRDFYIDNHTIGKVIENITMLLQESSARIMPHSTEYGVGESNALSSLENAEVYEPEFGEPVFVPLNELHGKLLILSKNSFFDKPRTVSETVNELREHEWIANPLDVSKILAKMAFSKELRKGKQADRSFYFVQKELLAN